MKTFLNSKDFWRDEYAKHFSHTCDPRAVQGIVKPWHIALRFAVVAGLILLVYLMN